MTALLWRVAWRSRVTGTTGHGEPMTLDRAELWAAHGNEHYPEIEHTVEPVEVQPPPTAKEGQ